MPASTESDRGRRGAWRKAVWGVAALLWLVLLVAMPFTPEVSWTETIAYGVILVFGLAFLKWSLGLALRRWGARFDIRGEADPAGLPLLVALLSVYMLVATPLMKTVIRVNEVEADIFGLNASAEPDGTAEVHLKLIEYRKADPGPIEEFLFFDHPSPRKRVYAAMRWKALRKLDYMDALMRSLKEQPPRVDNPAEIEPLRDVKKTLRQHYRTKRRHYGVDHPHFYDRDLRKLFSDAPEHAANMKAARFIARVRREVRRMVAEWTGEYQYTIDQVIENMIRRSNEMNLRLKSPEDRSKLDFTIMLTVQTMNYLHSGFHRVAL